ncbi:MAG: 4Fe-4S cluster-binding domain-containing protein [Streptomyces sp.]|nr:4Fe-4S cluster-binding domain-containing protein [Streptomyces sp.]
MPYSKYGTLFYLYRCNVACRHCFHGERLQHADAFTLDEAISLMRLMHKGYGAEAVNLPGGEPFVERQQGQGQTRQ